MKIENWHSLTEAQKKTASEQLKIIEDKKIKDNIENFKNNGFIKLKNVIDESMCLFLYNYIKLESERLSFIESSHANRELTQKEKNLWGTFDDTQALGCFSKYGDLVFDNLMVLLQEMVEKNIGLNIQSNYSYHRLYTLDSDLKRHKDRPSCELSTTLCLGFDRSNISKEEYPNWNWPMYVKSKSGEEIKIGMNPGDMIVYMGCDIEHWREPLQALNNAQVFLHYNEVNGKYDIKQDNRPKFGMTKSLDELKNE